ncbi:sodium:solute symporter [Chloroflexota bacterium]
MLELIIIVIYFTGMITLGLISRKKEGGVDEFFVAGRRGSTLFITGSLLATIIGGSATVGMAGLGFTRGLTGAWWLLAGSIGLVILGIFLAKKVRDMALFTLPGIVRKQYDRRVSLASSVLIIVAWLGIVAGQILAAGKIMGVLGIGSPALWMGLFTLVFVIYTILGGQQAIIRTDTVQSVIIFAGIFGGLALLLSRVGGFSGLLENLPQQQFSFPLSPQFDGYHLVSLLLLVGLTYVVGPDMYSRILCARDAGVARKSVFVAALLVIPFAFAITVMGMGAAVLFPQISPEQAFPTVIKEVFSPLMGGIVLAALLCAVMSSADTCLLSAGTILTMDIIKPLLPSLAPEKLIKISRWSILVLGAGSLAMALLLKGVISALLFAYTIYTGGLILPVLTGFYKDQLKVTSNGALAAVIGGGLTALASRIWQIKYLDIGSLLISLILLFIVSFIDNKMRERNPILDKK